MEDSIPYIGILLYIRLAGLFYYIRVGPDHTWLVSGDDLTITVRAVLIWNAVL